ncbi:MAG: sodium-dependent transporter [Faecalicatena sp.]|uniref:sodium-dependent transporter n=1 Tax=Faecalicatena sp. TaxID=2005360 RepID=UPI0025897DC7|nr:sodium-dependent transporter [Faecalicatena sp.]MCI6466030.1 sodium-dependent transporter [Faecalicatena sp.]MDY5620040.1 sodium-dependent transporter [Lachnospiraceae bacterium]
MKREKFGSRLGFILVSAGCAIGLGNVWKFPYMTGKFGGAAFILIYLVFLAILGMPIIVCEFSVGRASQKSIATSYNALEPEGTRWHFTRWFAIAGNYILVMFYSMVGGWMLYYCFRMAKGDFTDVTSKQVTQSYDQMLASPGTLMIWTVVVILIAFGICSIGLQKGVEKIMKVTMLCLLAIMVVLAVRSITLSGSAEGLRFYLVPDFHKMVENGIGNVIFGAMSQAFFTLSIGMGGMAIFGSYLDKSRSLTGESLSIVILDTFVALVAGLIVIPACFAFHVEPAAGPGLVFITLPNIFTQMTGGRIWGSLFFLFLFFAALSTIVGVFENIVSFGMDLFHFSRKKSVGINILLIAVLSIPCILGFSVWSDFQPLGAGTNIMDLEDFLVSNNILPLGSVVYLLFCTHKNGWGWKNFIQEANSGQGMKFPEKVRGYMTYVLPWVVVIIYLKGYYDMFSGQSTAIFVIWMVIAFLFLGMILMVSRAKPKK